MIRRIMAVVMLMLLPLPAAALDSVTVTPGVAYVQGSGSALVTLRWNLQITVPTEQSVTVTSTGGTLVPGAAAPVPLGGMLRRTFRLTAGTHLVRITERLRIDRTSARYILEGPPGSFSRVFTDTLAGTATAVVTLQGRSSGSGGLTLQNIELSFDDGTEYRVVATGEAMTARVSLATSGRGLIRGKWEIAGPEGGFRLLGRANLPAGGPKRVEIASPPLPTDRPGKYRLRFVVDGDGQGSGDLVIAYSVGTASGPASISLTAPAEGAALASRTRFRWEPTPGASRYRIEFLSDGGLKPLAAIETAEPGTIVRSFTLDRLALGEALVWRVLALDASGRVIAQSSKRRIAAP